MLSDSRIVMLPPMGYLEMLGLMKGAKCIFTDSGGVQEEATALGLPCLTLRENTERPITVSEGTNTIVGTDEKLILSVFHDIISGGGKTGRIPELWDGKAAERLVLATRNWLESQ
jgi:UDP-N-acetylglucosamine 2-epimerase (non-hydrolysing)